MDERREHHNQNGEPFADSFSDGDAGGFERLEDAGEAVAWDDATAAARLEREGRRRPSLDRAMRAFDPEAGAGAAADKLERIKRELDSVPALPGVYLWKDKSGQVIYVGKAKQLRARMRQYVNFQDDRAEDTAAGRPDRQLRLHRGGERARVAGAGEEPHQPAQPVLQRRLQGRQVLPVHRAHQGRRVSRPSSTRARGTDPTRKLLRTLHRQPRRPRHGGHRAPRGPFVRHVVRRMARA